MAYTKYRADWQNGSAGGTPLDADGLDHIEDGIVAAAATADNAESIATTNSGTIATNQGDIAAAQADADAAQATANAAIAESTATTKGDLLVASGVSTVTRLGVGTDERLLEADSGATNGVKWGRKITIDSVAPSGPSVGDLWLKPVT